MVKSKFKIKDGFALVIILLGFIVIPSKLDAKPKQTFEVGVLFKLEERYDKTIDALVQGIELARLMFLKEHSDIEINLHKASHGRELSSIPAAVNGLLEKKVSLIIGGEDSDQSVAIGDMLVNKNVVFITPTSTSPTVTFNKPFVFRSCFSDDYVGAALAKFAFAKKLHAIGVIHDVSSPYTDNLAKFFLQSLQELSKNSKDISIIEEKIVEGTTDFHEQISRFKKAGVSLVAALIYETSLLRFANQAKGANFYPDLLGSDGWGPSDGVRTRLFNTDTRSRQVAFQTAYWQHDSTHQMARRFKEEFKKTFLNHPNAWHAMGFDAAWLAFTAMTNTKGSNNAVAIREALQKIGTISLVTTKSFRFADNNSPIREIPLYEISAKGIVLKNVLR